MPALLKILICDDNEYFKYGLQEVLNSTRTKENSISFSQVHPSKKIDNYDSEVMLIRNADIIFNAMDIQGNNIYRDLFRYITPRTILINIAKDSHHQPSKRLKCTKHAFYISRNESCEKYLKLVKIHRIENSRGICNKKTETCKDCIYSQLTKRQKIVAACIHKKLSNHEIETTLGLSSSKLNISKRRLMDKLNLKSNYELIQSLNFLFTKNN
jgi:DNA-binding NarL/FixJ family response regulator